MHKKGGLSKIHVSPGAFQASWITWNFILNLETHFCLLALLRLFSVAKTHCKFDDLSFTSVSFPYLKAKSQMSENNCSLEMNVMISRKNLDFVSFVNPSFLLEAGQILERSQRIQILDTSLNTLLATQALQVIIIVGFFAKSIVAIFEIKKERNTLNEKVSN